MEPSAPGSSLTSRAAALPLALAGRRDGRAAAAPIPPLPDLAGARAAATRIVRDGVLPCLAYGVTDARGRGDVFAVGSRRSPAEPDSIFFIASVTKAIVTTAVMQYVDEGRLDLDAPLARYLPAFSGQRRDDVSAWHVLTHTSGLPDVPMATLRARRPSYQQLLDEALRSVPAWEPGSRYEYNSAAWVLLSEVMARLSGMDFATALRTRLTQPLGMVDTTFDPRHARTRIRPMNGFGMGNRIVGELLLRFLARAQLPGGGLFGTVPDLLRLGRSLLPPPPDAGNGVPNVRVLSLSAIARMSERQTDGIPQVAEDGSSSAVAQALGWRKPGPSWPRSEAAITHGGISGSRIWVDPERGLAYAFLTNLWAAPDDPAIEVLGEVYRALGVSAA